MSGKPAQFDSAPEQRRAQRKRVLWSGMIEFEGNVLPCVILDLSATGAKIRIERSETEIAKLAPPLHATITLSSKHFETMRAQLAWRRRNLFGLHFEEAPARIATVLAHVLPLFRADGTALAPAPAPRG